MPDRKQGYVKRNRGVLTPNQEMAAKYRTAMKEPPIEFDDTTQLALLDSILESQVPQRFESYFIATDLTHVHLLVGWRDTRTWLRMRSTIKSSMSRYLNDQIGRREWFVEGGSRKRVKDQTHFDYLVTKYLPRHTGWEWSSDKGKYR